MDKARGPDLGTEVSSLSVPSSIAQSLDIVDRKRLMAAPVVNATVSMLFK